MIPKDATTSSGIFGQSTTTNNPNIQNPFSKPLLLPKSGSNSFLKPNNQPLPLLASTANQSKMSSNADQFYGGQKMTPNFVNSNGIFASSSNNSMMQNKNSSNPLNLKKSSSNIFSNTTGNISSGSSPNLYNSNQSAVSSPFGLTQPKTQFNISGNCLSFKPIKTENAKLDPKHLVSCIAMEKRYLDQKLSK